MAESGKQSSGRARRTAVDAAATSTTTTTTRRGEGKVTAQAAAPTRKRASSAKAAKATKAAEPAKIDKVAKTAGTPPNGKVPTPRKAGRQGPAEPSPASAAPAAAPVGTRDGPRTPEAPAPSATASPVAPGALMVRDDEAPWTGPELAEVRAELEDEVSRLRHEVVDADSGIQDLLRDFGDGAGEDQADQGSKTFEREHEMSLANNARDMLMQAERALHRMDDGTYGKCESCGNAIGKMRLQAFPRATLCMTCKQREERR